MNSLPVENLEQRAVEQRNALHQTTAELKAKIIATRERFDVSHSLRRHFAAAAVAVAVIGVASGYRFGGLFAHR